VPTPAEESAPVYEDYAEWWLKAKVDGVIGKRPISSSTAKGYRWRLGYSKRFFVGMEVEEIDRHACLEFKANLLAEAREQREAIEAGAELRAPRDAGSFLSASSRFKMILDALQPCSTRRSKTNIARTIRLAPSG
jgi:hypothetical protein